MYFTWLESKHAHETFIAINVLQKLLLFNLKRTSADTIVVNVPALLCIRHSRLCKGPSCTASPVKR